MKINYDDFISKVIDMQTTETSDKGLWMYTFIIDKNLLSNEDKKNPLFECTGSIGNEIFISDIVFCSENLDTTRQLHSLTKITNRNNHNNNNNKAELIQNFLHEHTDCFVKFHDVKQFSYWEENMLHVFSDQKRYQDILKSLDVGVCHLVLDDKFLTFRLPSQNYDRDNLALKSYYKKPIHTQEEVAQYGDIVKKLYNAGKLVPEVTLTGNAAKLCIDNINSVIPILPNNYEFEQMSILKKYAQIQDYEIVTSVDKNNIHTIKMDTPKGNVNIKLPKKDDELLSISYDKKRNIKISLTDFIDQFYYDKTKDKINNLVKKFKIK